MQVFKKLSKPRIQYLIRSFQHRRQSKCCPFCNSSEVVNYDQKWIVTRLLRCERCKLLFRWPRDSAETLDKFYQEEYAIDTGIITKFPSDSELQAQILNDFPDVRDYSPILEAIIGSQPVGEVRVIDYGCSWGYTLFKLISRGYDAQGFEVSLPRARFGVQNLNVPIVSAEEQLKNECDFFVSSHVIEHLSDLNAFVQISRAKLNNNGIFIAFCPNGNSEFRERRPDVFHGGWGLEHINYLSVDFARNLFDSSPFYITTGDWDYDLEAIRKWNRSSQVIGDILDGEELLIIALPHIDLK